MGLLGVDISRFCYRRNGGFLWIVMAVMRVFVSTVVRGAPVEAGGELISIDWQKKKVLKRVPIFPTNPTIPDPNARGGARGGRGIALLPNELFVACYHSLLGFDYDLNPTRRITNHQFAGLHEIKLVSDGIWVSSTPLGAAVKVDFNGNLQQAWWAHEDPVVQQRFKPPPLFVDKQQDNRLSYTENFSKLHLNNVEVHDGHVYVSLNNHGAVLRLYPTEIVAHDPALKGCHNGLVTDEDEILLNDSHGHTVIVFDLHSGHVKRRIDLASFPEVARLMRSGRFKNVPWQVRARNFIARKRMARPLFTRGMCRLDGSRLLVGVSPATVLELDYKQGRLLDLCQLSDSPNECVHGLEAAPSVDFPYSL
jgi:hypothetical protein